MKIFASLLTVAVLASCQAAQRMPVPAADAADGAHGVDVPEPPVLAIGQVQGRSARSPYLERQVTVQGVVVGNFSKGLQGVFVQSERDDDDAHTAEGLFVEHGADALPALRRGDRVRVSGRVVEQGDRQASLTALTDTVVQVLGQAPVRVRDLAQAPAQAEDWERYEGMALRVTAPLTVSGNEGLSRYGEVTASFGGRLFQPTEVLPPGPAAAAMARDNARRTLLLDDNRTSKDPDTLWFLDRPLDDAQALRAGSKLRLVTGVLDQRRGKYRLQLADKLSARQAPRPPPPKVPGNVRLASLNLLNLFNGDGRGAGFPTGRGAQTAQQYAQQQRKLVAVVQALAPDVAALMEVENDGSGPESALAQFVAALNHAGPARDYRFIDSGPQLGDDAIRVALIYRSTRVWPQGQPASLGEGPFAGRSRVPLAQAFQAGQGPVFVVSANHFKSKGCGSDQDKAQGAQADQRDGQSCWNPLRLASAQQLHAWLAGDPTKSGTELVVLLGDLNAHAQEDPLRWLRDAGWRDAFASVGLKRPYSYVFDGQAGRLDHALLSAAAAARLRGAAEWHNNSDESEFFDYHRDLDGDPYRASDHDPILLGLDLAR